MLAVFDDIESELNSLEDELKKAVNSAEPLIRETSIHLINSGGKRLRPALCFLGAKFYNYDPQKVMPLAVAMELTHMASLVHDDVVDSSSTRRNNPTVKAVWGNKVSIHLGDYLLGKSLQLISGYENLDIAKILANTSVKMAEGEIHQIKTANKVDVTVKDYLYRTRRKTALFISGSCCLGAMACGAQAPIWHKLKKYGNYIGMAFQIIDDIMDLSTAQERLGKPIGSDLRQGVVTLPVIYAMKQSKEKDKLKSIVAVKEKTSDMIETACRIVIASGGIEYADNTANKYVNKALRELEGLPELPVKEILVQAADFIMTRDF